jgi:hypothetical protein
VPAPSATAGRRRDGKRNCCREMAALGSLTGRYCRAAICLGGHLGPVAPTGTSDHSANFADAEDGGPIGEC